MKWLGGDRNKRVQQHYPLLTWDSVLLSITLVYIPWELEGARRLHVLFLFFSSESPLCFLTPPFWDSYCMSLTFSHLDTPSSFNGRMYCFITTTSLEMREWAQERNLDTQLQHSAGPKGTRTLHSAPRVNSLRLMGGSSRSMTGVMWLHIINSACHKQRPLVERDT